MFEKKRWIKLLKQNARSSSNSENCDAAAFLFLFCGHIWKDKTLSGQNTSLIWLIFQNFKPLCKWITDEKCIYDRCVLYAIQSVSFFLKDLLYKIQLDLLKIVTGSLILSFFLLYGNCVFIFPTDRKTKGFQSDLLWKSTFTKTTSFSIFWNQ